MGYSWHSLCSSHAGLHNSHFTIEVMLHGNYKICYEKDLRLGLGKVSYIGVGKSEELQKEQEFEFRGEGRKEETEVIR